MKKIITVFLYGIIISFAVTINVKAQSLNKGIAFADSKSNPAATAFANETGSVDKDPVASRKESLNSATMDIKTSKANLKTIKASFKASENFKRNFKNVGDEKWQVDEKAIVAFFIKDDVKTNVVYNKNGSWIHTLTYYHEEKMPTDIKQIIERDFPDDDITLAVDIKEGDMNFYIVQLENKTTYKKVSVYNGETNVFEILKKSK
jgi:hypothetical protein